MGNVAQKSEKSIAGAIKINEKEIVDHLDQLMDSGFPVRIKEVK